MQKQQISVVLEVEGLQAPPPFSALPSLSPSILLGKGSGGTPPSEGLRWRLDQFSAGLFGQVKRTSCLIAFRIFCRFLCFLGMEEGGQTRAIIAILATVVLISAQERGGLHSQVHRVTGRVEL